MNSMQEAPMARMKWVLQGLKPSSKTPILAASCPLERKGELKVRATVLLITAIQTLLRSNHSPTQVQYSQRIILRGSCSSCGAVQHICSDIKIATHIYNGNNLHWLPHEVLPLYKLQRTVVTLSCCCCTKQTAGEPGLVQILVTVRH